MNRLEAGRVGRVLQNVLDPGDPNKNCPDRSGAENEGFDSGHSQILTRAFVLLEGMVTLDLRLRKDRQINSWQRRSKQLLVLVLVIAGSIAVMLPAWAQTTTTSDYVDQAANALIGDPVYVHPDAADALSEDEASALREKIARSNAGPIYIAVLPEEARRQAGGSTAEVLKEIVNAMQRDGTYAVVIGNELRAGNTRVGGTVPALATEAVQANRGGGAAAVLSDFVDRLARMAADGGLEGSNERGGGSPLVPLTILAVGGGVVAAMMRKRKIDRRVIDQKQLKEVKDVALEDLVALGEDLRALDLQVEMPTSDPRAKEEYVRALGEYESATGSLDKANRLQDIQKVSQDLAEGRYAIQCAKARLEGKEPPAKREPCFFDPRHGPSVTDVEWSPDGSGATRRVPACAADAALVAGGTSPKGREITVEGRRVPYWEAPAYYGPWAGGYWGGGGLLQGMILGSMFGGGFGGGGWGSGMGGGDADGGMDGGGDFGDFGGGFGGGDFGGGGFGGGDFGGGDFGG